MDRLSGGCLYGSGVTHVDTIITEGSVVEHQPGNSAGNIARRHHRLERMRLLRTTGAPQPQLRRARQPRHRMVPGQPQARRRHPTGRCEGTKRTGSGFDDEAEYLATALAFDSPRE